MLEAKTKRKDLTSVTEDMDDNNRMLFTPAEFCVRTTELLNPLDILFALHRAKSHPQSN